MAIQRLTPTEMQDIAERSCTIYFKDSFGVFRAVTDDWTWRDGSALRNQIVIPAAVLGISWAIDLNPEPKPEDIDAKAAELATGCDLSMLERMKFPQYNIDGIRESLIFPTIADATSTALGASATRQELLTGEQ